MFRVRVLVSFIVMVSVRIIVKVGFMVTISTRVREG